MDNYKKRGGDVARKINAQRAKMIAYKCFVYAVALFILSTAQVTFFAKINILGATPDLMLGAVLVIAMKDEKEVAAICGIISGFFYCALGGFVYPFYLMFSFLCGYTLWGVSDRFLGKNYISYLALAILTFALKAVFNLIETSLFAYSFNLLNMISRAIVPEFISSMVFCSLSYLIFSAIAKLLNLKSKKGRT